MNLQQILKNTTSKNYKAYLLFVLLTLILWFAIQLTKTYNFQSELVIQLSNTPKHIVLDSSEIKVELNLNSNGFKLWRYNFLNKTFRVDYSEFQKDSLQLKISANKLKKAIAKSYELTPEEINLDKTMFSFKYQKKETKLVPVKPNLKLNFAAGYNTLESLSLSPDSVTISGSRKDLRSVNFVQTNKMDIKNANDTLQGNVKLIKPSSNVEISLESVEYYLPVEKYSENALMIPINTINIPDSLDVSVFPNKAKVSFLVALKSFDKVSEIDFKVVCDYNKRYQQDAIMIPSLVNFPNYILNPKLHIRKVDYLVKQKP
jgi:YbbR domain-containing protein